MIMAVTPEAWNVVGNGIVVLIATSHRHLRAEMNKKVHGCKRG